MVFPVWYKAKPQYWQVLLPNSNPILCTDGTETREQGIKERVVASLLENGFNTVGEIGYAESVATLNMLWLQMSFGT